MGKFVLAARRAERHFGGPSVVVVGRTDKRTDGRAAGAAPKPDKCVALTLYIAAWRELWKCPRGITRVCVLAPK